MNAANANVHEGTIKSIVGNHLVRTCAQGNDHSHTLAADAKVTCLGNTCQIDFLEPGMKIRVTTKDEDPIVVTHLEVTDLSKLCGNSHDGEVVSLKGSKLVMTGAEGKVHSHIVAADAKVTCDGKIRKARDLKVGMKVRVTTKEHDRNVATGIEYEKLDR